MPPMAVVDVRGARVARILVFGQAPTTATETKAAKGTEQ